MSDETSAKTSRKPATSASAATIRVRATERGYCDALREPGDVFDVPSEWPPATWYEPATEGDTKAPRA